MDNLLKINKEIILLKQTIAIISWDQETYMPAEAITDRSQQVAMLETIVHNKICSKEFNDALESADISQRPKDWSETEAKCYIKNIKEDIEKQKKLPSSFVNEFALTCSESQFAWIKAKNSNDYSIFKPYLEKVINLNKQKAAYLDDKSDAYDVLLQEYEKGESGENIANVFQDLKEFLIDFIPKAEEITKDALDISKIDFDVQKQEEFGKKIAKEIGYDFSRGSLDVSEHPFTTTLGFDDVRITARYFKNEPFSSLYSIIHEAGHGIYEQGFAEKFRYTDLADATSLAVHESQSRFWENIICKSKEFISYMYEEYTETFFDKKPTEKEFYNTVNFIKPSLVRVEADEVTYSMHVIIRFEIERALMQGKISLDELPAIWNQKYKDYLGVEPKSDSEGILQDVHWSMGAFGYFPTYALGNLYGAQFTSKMEKEIPDYKNQILNGQFSNIKNWVNENIHRFGTTYTAIELCKNITGENLNAKYFKEYLKNKYSL